MRAVAELVLPAGGGGQVEVQDDGAVAVRVDFAFGGDDAFERTKSGEVRRGDVSNQRHVRAGECRQRGDFAGVVRAHFNHGEAVFIT